MTLREPEAVYHNGKSIAEHLDLHEKWRRGEKGGVPANLSGADLIRLDLSHVGLSGADLSGADLDGAIGNMREVKSAQIDAYPITWTMCPHQGSILQIGCQSHTLEEWRAFDFDVIHEMDGVDALEWWAEWKDMVIALVEKSPAVPFAIHEGVE